MIPMNPCAKILAAHQHYFALDVVIVNCSQGLRMRSQLALYIYHFLPSPASPSSSPILPWTTPPTGSETCATSAAANIIWNTTPVGRTIGKICRQADPQLLDFRSMVRRTCNTGGVWGDPDFSECTVSRGTNAFLLVWFVVQSDSVVTVNNRRQQLEEEVRTSFWGGFIFCHSRVDD